MLTLLLIFEILLLFGIGASVEHDFWFTSIAGTIAGLLVVFWFFSWPAFHLVMLANWPLFLAGFVGWFVVGGLTSIVKWRSYLKKPDVVQEIKNAHQSWNTSAGGGKQSGVSFEDYYFNPVKLESNYSRIVHWIVFWPAVWFWALTYKLVYHVSNFVFNLVKNILLSITRSQVDKIVSK